MVRRIGKCVNSDKTCRYANGDEVVEITGVSPGVPALCPGCGRQLYEISTRKNQRPMLWGALAVLGGLALAGGFLWLFSFNREIAVSTSLPQDTAAIQQQQDLPGGPSPSPGPGGRPAEPPPVSPQPVGNVTMPACLQKAERLHNLLPLTAVAGSNGATIPQPLHDYMKLQIDKPIHEAPFYIMRREVQVGEFRQYVQTLDPARQAQLGTAWAQGQDSHPVAAVPWWAARGYADWLARESGCPVDLPTYNQWIAAALQHAQSEDVILRRDAVRPRLEPREASPATVVDLLGNLREWALDSSGPLRCQGDGHYALGEDYQTYPQLLAGEPRCVSQPWPTVGFRVVVRHTTPE